MREMTPHERRVLAELQRIADPDLTVTATQLRDAGFADFVARVYDANVGYPQSLQSRKLQILRDKGYLKMEHGKYTLLSTPSPC